MIDLFPPKMGNFNQISPSILTIDQISL